MNLKLVVASMSVLGLVSFPAFAADTTDTTATDATAKHTTHHHHHHHKMMKHHVRHHERERVREEERVNYKEEAFVAQPPVEVCSISQSVMIYDEATQNWGRALPNPCNPGWYNRVAVSGGANLDLGKWGDKDAGFQGENYEKFSLNDVYLNLTANINDWTKAFASISYSNTSDDGGPDSDSYGYSSVYSDHDLSLEQVYVTFANFDVNPLFLQVGKQFEDFSRYEIHPITRSMTQVLSEALHTTVKGGFILPMGFNGSVGLFDDSSAKIGNSRRSTDYVVALGYDQPNDQFGYDLGAAWIYNMMGAQDVAHGVSNFTGGGYNRHTGGFAVYGDVNSGPFTLGVRWTGAVQRFNKNDLPSNGVVDEISDDVISPTAHGAKPWAVGVQAGYGFEAFGCKRNNIYLGYQTSRETAGLGLPKTRWQLGYGIEWWRYADFGFEWDHDNDHSRDHGGDGDNTNLVTIRVAAKFG